MWPMKRPAVQEVRLALPDGSRHDLHNGREPLQRRSSLFSRNRLERQSSTPSVLATVLLVALALLTVAALLIADPAGVTSPRAHDARPVTAPFGGNPHAFGLSPSTGAQGAAQVHQIEGLLGRKVDLVNFFLGWNDPGFDTKALDQIEALGALPEVTWEPWDYRRGTNQGHYALSRIIAGDFDGYIRSWARAAAAWGKPLMLRFAQEMNGNWYPWGAAVNGNSPGEYVQAYRHIHKLFTSVGATNVIWVWSPNILYPGGVSLSSVYPGNAYVNWIGVDGYNWGTSIPRRGGWRSPSAVFVPTLNALKRLAPTKPVMIAETASAEQGGNKADWITNLFTLLQHYSEVKAVVWFNYVNGPTDWQITSSKTSVQAMANSLSSDWQR